MFHARNRCSRGVLQRWAVNCPFIQHLLLPVLLKISHRYGEGISWISHMLWMRHTVSKTESYWICRSKSFRLCKGLCHTESLSVAAAVQLASFSFTWGYCMYLSITHWSKWWPPAPAFLHCLSKTEIGGVFAFLFFLILLPVIGFEREEKNQREMTELGRKIHKPLLIFHSYWTDNKLDFWLLNS